MPSIAVLPFNLHTLSLIFSDTDKSFSSEAAVVIAVCTIKYGYHLYHYIENTTFTTSSENGLFQAGQQRSSLWYD